jgi:hypothetical protein
MTEKADEIIEEMKKTCRLNEIKYNKSCKRLKDKGCEVNDANLTSEAKKELDVELEAKKAELELEKKKTLTPEELEAANLEEKKKTLTPEELEAANLEEKKKAVKPADDVVVVDETKPPVVESAPVVTDEQKPVTTEQEKPAVVSAPAEPVEGSKYEAWLYDMLEESMIQTGVALYAKSFLSRYLKENCKECNRALFEQKFIEAVKAYEVEEQKHFDKLMGN